MPEPKRITVNFAEDVGLTSTAPDPVQESQASVAPELGEQVAPPPVDLAPRLGDLLQHVQALVWPDRAIPVCGNPVVGPRMVPVVPQRHMG